MTIKQAENLCGGFRKVSSLESPKTGRGVANQFRVVCENGVLFQSYNTVICVQTDGHTYLRAYEDTPRGSMTAYSRTTAKYLGVFLNERSQTVREKIKRGDYEIIPADR